MIIASVRNLAICARTTLGLLALEMERNQGTDDGNQPHESKLRQALPPRSEVVAEHQPRRPKIEGGDRYEHCHHHFKHRRSVLLERHFARLAEANISATAATFTTIAATRWQRAQGREA